MADNNIHKNHRQRMRDKYEKHGSDIFETHELVEMLLYHSMRQGDTNPIAHDYLSARPDGAFGIRTAKELTDIRGIGENSANLLRISSDTVLRLLCDVLSAEPMKSEFSIKTFLWLWFKNKPEKTVAALLLDSKNRYIDCAYLAQGRSVRPEDYSEALLFLMNKNSAKSVVICHNHKNNSTEPSMEDILLTGYLRRSLEDNGFNLKAHYIVTDADCVECSIC